MKQIVIAVPKPCFCCHCHYHEIVDMTIVLSPRVRGTVMNHAWATTLQSFTNWHSTWKHSFGKGDDGALEPGGSYEVVKVTEERVEFKYYNSNTGTGPTLLAGNGELVFMRREDFTSMSGGLSLKPNGEIEFTPDSKVVIHVRY